MKYFMDFEFLEGDIPVKIFGLNIPKWLIKPNNTIQPISIGLVSSDNREYYAISKDFNLKEAWNRYDLEPDIDNGGIKKVYWIRENVLRPIFDEFLNPVMDSKDNNLRVFNYKNFKTLVNKYGKSNKQIAEEIKSFTMQYSENENEIWDKPKFYAYFADYDWVAFCWLFGKMIDLPKGFPMYSKDLKQILDDKVSVFCAKEIQDTSFESAVKRIKMHKDYPKQTNEHNALADAKWNKELYEFLKDVAQ